MRLHEKERIRRELMQLSFEGLSQVETRIEHNIPHLDLSVLQEPGNAQARLRATRAIVRVALAALTMLVWWSVAKCR